MPTVMKTTSQENYEEYNPTVITKWRIQADSYDEIKNTSQDSYDEMKNTSRQLLRNDKYKPRQLW
jgi:hypothetical protein